jgi:anti-anti-sigma regulatory factor
MVDWEHTKEIGETVEKLGFYLVHEYPDGISLARLVPADPRNADASITISEFCSRRAPFVIIDLDDCSQPQACSLGALMNCHLDLNSAGGHEVFIHPRGDFRIRLESTNLLSCAESEEQALRMLREKKKAMSRGNRPQAKPARLLSDEEMERLRMD